MSQQWKSESTGGEDDVQLPLGAGGAEAAPAEEYTGGGGSRVRVNSSTVALFGAFAAAVVVLYLLGLQNKPRTVSASERAHQQEVDNQFNRILNTNEPAKVGEFLSGRDTQYLTKIFIDYFNAHAIPLDLPGNPFEKEEVRVVEAGPTVVAPPVMTTDPVKAKRIRDTAEEFSHLKLQGIMMGPTPAALIQINGKTRMVTAGESFTCLKVANIQADGILLTNETGDYRLTQDGPDKNK